MSGSERRGITLFTEDGDPVEVLLMDENDNWINYAYSPEDGFYAYRNAGHNQTLVLEDAR